MKEYYVSINGQQQTVVPADTLSRDVAAGKYPENTLIWCEGMTDWEPIKNHFQSPETNEHDCLDAQPEKTISSPKAPLKTAKRKVLIIIGLAVLGLCSLILMCIPKSKQSVLVDAYTQFAASIEEDNWSLLYEKFNKALDYERYSNHHYADGTRRETPLYKEEVLLARALRRARVKLARSPRIRYCDDIDFLYSKWSSAERELHNLNPDNISLIEELTKRRDKWKRDLHQKCKQNDINETIFLISFLADGELNVALTEAINLAYELKKTNIEDQNIAIIVHQLSQLYANRKRILAEIPHKGQLYILDEYERELADDKYVKASGYQSSQELVALRNQLRAVIKRNMSQARNQ